MEEQNLFELTETLFEGFQIDGAALASAVGSGNIAEAGKIFMEALLAMLGHPLTYMKEYLLALIGIGVGAAFLKQLNLFFKESEAADCSFWVVYLLLAKQLVTLYYNGEGVARECLNRVIDFGHVFIPVFSLVLTMASGSITGAGYIATLTLIIYVIEQFLLIIMLPLAEGYMLLCLLGALWQTERVEKLLEFLEKGIALGFKGMFAAITGLGVLQSMLLPYADQAKSSAARRLVEQLPGVGSLLGSTMELLGGSAVLLKNGVGMIGLLLLLLAAAAPMLKIGLLCLIMRLAAVVYGLLGEKKLTWCADRLGQAEGYILRIAGAGVMLFLLWIVLAVYTTNLKGAF